MHVLYNLVGYIHRKLGSFSYCVVLYEFFSLVHYKHVFSITIGCVKILFQSILKKNGSVPKRMRTKKSYKFSFIRKIN